MNRDLEDSIQIGDSMQVCTDANKLSFKQNKFNKQNCMTFEYTEYHEYLT